MCNFSYLNTPDTIKAPSTILSRLRMTLSFAFECGSRLCTKAYCEEQKGCVGGVRKDTYATNDCSQLVASRLAVLTRFTRNNKTEGRVNNDDEFS